MTNIDLPLDPDPDRMVVIIYELDGDRDILQGLGVLNAEEEGESDARVRGRNARHPDGVPASSVDIQLAPLDNRRIGDQRCHQVHVPQCNTCPGRFDLSKLDDDDPFEVDADNRPHLFPNVLDLYIWNEALYYPADLAKGDAHWLLVGEIEGVVITVPLALPKSGDPAKCRPIGIYPAAADEKDRYIEDR